MTSKTLTILAVAFLASASLPALAQGGGGAGGGSGGASGASAGSASSSGTGAATTGSAATGGTQQAPNPQGPTGQVQNPSGSTSVENANAKSSAPAGSPTALQAQRNAGAGTAPNGLPIGAPGSGVGSPENPVDGSRQK